MMVINRIVLLGKRIFIEFDKHYILFNVNFEMCERFLQSSSGNFVKHHCIECVQIDCYVMNCISIVLRCVYYEFFNSVSLPQI